MAIEKIKTEGLSSSDLQTKLVELKTRYVKLKFNHAVTPLENPNQLGFLRKDIARLITALRKLELNK